MTTSSTAVPAAVLLVDDSDLILRTMARTLARAYSVNTASNGREALALLRDRQNFDVIVCDVGMPEMNGLEFYKVLLREYPGYADRFLFATGGAEIMGSVDFIFDAGVRVLLKPYNAQALRDAIEGVRAASDRTQL